MSNNVVSQKTNGDIESPANIFAPSSLVSDYPACVTWFKMHEGSGVSGTLLSDYIGNVTDMDVNYTGTGDPWSQGANPGDPIHSDNTASNYNYIRTNGEAPSVLQNVGSKSIILELDCQLLNVTDSDQIISLGQSDNSNQGLNVFWNGLGAQIQYRVGGADNVNIIGSFNSTPASLEGERRHLVVTHNRTALDTEGDIALYVDGVFVESKPLGTDPGLITVSGSGGRLGIGLSGNGGLNDIIDAYYWNARVWYIDGALPANMTQIVAQMESMRNEFPTLMAGIS